MSGLGRRECGAELEYCSFWWQDAGPVGQGAGTCQCFRVVENATRDIVPRSGCYVSNLPAANLLMILDPFHLVGLRLYIADIC